MRHWTNDNKKRNKALDIVKPSLESEAAYHFNVGDDIIWIKGYLVLSHGLVVVESHSRDTAISRWFNLNVL